jgi:hypothetical protein
MQVICKITYPNRKIYISQDRTDSFNYFGSANNELIAVDFTREQRRKFNVTREILWEAENPTMAEICAKEMEFIRMLRANDPEIGYNRNPRFRE